MALNVLYEKHDESGVVLVTEEAGVRSLWLGAGDRASAVKPGMPDYFEFAYIPVVLGALPVSPQRVLMIGLGGGSIASYLRWKYPAAVIDVVEISAAVVDVAKQFFGVVEDERTTIHLADGRDFLAGCREIYDAIVIDVFDGHNAFHFANSETFAKLASMLTAGGVLATVIWTAEFCPDRDALLAAYQATFSVRAVPGGDVGVEVLVSTRKE